VWGPNVRAFIRGAVATAVFLLPAALVAQTNPILDSQTIDGQTIDGITDLSLVDLLNIQVTSATRTQVRQSDAPARITVITREQIRRHGYRYLRDVFADLPGYQVGYWSTAEWGTTLVVRGLAGNHRLVFLLDGKRLNPPGGEEVPLFANYPLTFVEHIEVMYGPGSALYGNDAFNGIVNIVTMPLYPHDGVLANASGGSHGATDVSAIARHTFGPLEVRLGMHYTRTGQPNVYDLYPGDYSYRVPGSAQPARLDAIISPTHDLGNFDAHESGYDGILFVGTKQTHVTFQLRGYGQSSAWDQNASGAPFVNQARFADQQYLASFSHAVEAGRWRSTSSADYAHYAVLPVTRFVSPLNLGARTFSETGRAGSSSAIRLEEQVDCTFVPDRVSLTLGVAGQDVRVTPISQVDVDDISYRRYTGPGDTATVDDNGFVRDTNPVLFTAPATLSNSDSMRFQTVAGFGQLLWNPSKYFHLTTGVRLDYSTRFGLSTNPRVAVVSAPFETTSLKLLYGQAYLEPTPYQVYGVLTSRDSLLFPNARLKPEKLQSLELVWEQRLGRHLRFQTGAFVNRVVDFINDTAWTRQYVYVQVGSDQLQRRRELQSSNAGDALYYGGETTAHLTAGRVQSSLSLSWLDGVAHTVNLRGDLSEGPPPNVSTLMLKGGVNVELPLGIIADLRGRFQTAPDIRFVPADYPLAASPAPSLVLDAALRYPLDEVWAPRPLRGIDLYIDGRNLTDQRYKQPSGRPAVNPTGTPQPPLQIMAGVELTI
jgi:iron complex outermembrane receptor protein